MKVRIVAKKKGYKIQRNRPFMKIPLVIPFIWWNVMDKAHRKDTYPLESAKRYAQSAMAEYINRKKNSDGNRVGQIMQTIDEKDYLAMKLKGEVE